MFDVINAAVDSTGLDLLLVVTLKVRATVIVQVAQGLATILLGEQSATEVEVLDKVSQNSRKV